MLASPVAMSTDESFSSTTTASSSASTTGSSSTGCLQDEATPFTVILKTEGELCFGCGQVITQRYLLKVSGRAWHVQCLRCSVCDSTLDHQNSCYIKGDNIYCKADYNREFGTKCSKCCRSIQSSDWVRRAKDNVYHLACFACDSCKRQLSTGEEFALQDDRLLCKTHYIETVEGGPNEDDSASQKQKAKRIRTTFSEEQLQVLQANFQLDSNPDGQDLERIAQITGLSKRVTQVWFQNSRARQKKHQTAQPAGKSVHQQHQHDINNLNNVNTLNSINNMSISMSLSTSLSSLNSSYSTSPPSDGAEFMLDCDSPSHADHLQRISPLVITPLTTASVDRDARHTTDAAYSTHFFDKSLSTALPAV